MFREFLTWLGLSVPPRNCGYCPKCGKPSRKLRYPNVTVTVLFCAYCRQTWSARFVIVTGSSKGPKELKPLEPVTDEYDGPVAPDWR